jgi:hypothetical protein
MKQTNSGTIRPPHADVSGGGRFALDGKFALENHHVFLHSWCILVVATVISHHRSPFAAG